MDKLEIKVHYGGPIRGFTGGFFPDSAQYIDVTKSAKVLWMALIYICKFRELDYVHPFSAVCRVDLRQMAEYLGTRNLRVNSYIWPVVKAVFHGPRTFMGRSALAGRQANSLRGGMETEAVCPPGVRTNQT